MGRRPTKREPDLPDLPADLADAPGDVTSGDRWEAVAAGPATSVPERVADLGLSGCRWSGAELRGRRITGLRAVDVEFDHCDLSGAVLDSADLRRVRFTDCRLSGIVLSGATLTDVRLEESRADLASFRMGRASHLLVSGTSLRGADFYEFQATDCAFLGCDLDEAVLDGARLPGVRLRGSSLEGVRGALALRGAEISVDQIVPLGTAVLAALDVRVTP